MKLFFAYHKFRIVALAIFTIAVFFTATANAYELQTETQSSAIELAQRINAENLVTDQSWSTDILTTSSLSPEDKLSKMRMSLMSLIWRDDPNLISLTLDQYTELAAQSGTQRDQDISQLLDLFFKNFDGSLSEKNLNSVKPLIEPYLASEDWFIRHRALFLLGILELNSVNASISLQSAQDAFRLIPKEESVYTLEAKILSTEDIAHLHNTLGNPELGVATSKDQIALQKRAGVPIDGATIINNLIFSFSVWRDQATTKALIDILLDLEEGTETSVPGLTYLRAAQVSNEIGDFAMGLQHAATAFEIAEIKPLQESAKLSQIVALAGLGRTSQASKVLDEFMSSVPDDNFSSTSAKQSILHAQALIAAGRGDIKRAMRLMNERMDITVQYILSTNNAESASMIASLQNSKERQDEREKALTRETNLKQIALDRQKRVNNLLIILALIFGTAAVVAFAFARYRSRIAARMSLAADRARAGEKAKSEFLAVMSHELRTPLNGILGLADYLTRTAPTEDMREKNAIILQSGNDLLGLVENILDMTLIEGKDIHPQAQDINIRKTLAKQEQKWREVITKTDVIFTSFIAPDVPETLMVDPKRLTQCIDNLLSNAAKFTMVGRIHMHVTAESNTDSDTTLLKIIVADTGTGISEDAQTRLFKPFVQADSSMTRHFGGAGLGLAITQNLARLMGGDLTVVSRENRGSEFTLTITGQNCVEEPTQDYAPIMLATDQGTPAPTANEVPQHATPPGNKAVPAPIVTTGSTRQPQTHDAQIALTGLNVLVVEDDIPSQDVLRAILGPKGCHIKCVEDGQVALKMLMQADYDIVLMDIRMPGMDGVTTVRHIRSSRQAHQHIPIIAITADVAAETNAKCMAAGVDIFLTKPLRTEELMDAIAFVMEQNQARKLA